MQTILITGTSKGIGKAVAQKFLSGGFQVFGTSTSGIVDYSHDNLRVFKLDLRSSESIATCVAEIEKTDVSFDIVLNNAGVLRDEEEIALVPKKLRETLEVNLIGTADFTERILQLVKKDSLIAFTSSTAGSLELTGDAKDHWPKHYPAYKISKAALNMYMRTLALRLKSFGTIVL
ncbi:MAG: SDR family NAD(P)-dependent oxidoreductase, partial [Patescibacteria group bacterium]